VLPEAGAAKVEVFDISGRRVRTLFSGDLDSGAHPLHWDGRTDSGNRVGAGVYLVRAKARSLEASRKIVLIP